MKTLKHNQNGFSFVAILLILVVIGVVAFAGLKVYELQNTSDVDDTATVQSDDASLASESDNTSETAIAAEDVPNKVESADDLASTEKLLDSASSDTSTSSLDSDLATF